MISAKNEVIIDTISKTGLNTYKTLCDYLEMAKVISDPLGDDDLEYALKMTGKIKNIIPTLPLTYEFNEIYWRAMKFEAPYKFESFLFYMEKNRKPNKRFYQPRAKTLKIVVDDLQDLEDGLLDFYGLSLPPRVGKLIADDTPVLTDEGWKNHGDLKVGDYVYDYDGLPVMITHVFPKNFANKRVWFTDGSYVDCHENHEWIIRDRHLQTERIAETKELVNTEYIDKKTNKKRYMYQIPLYQPILGAVIDLPVKPYTLGAWLGDGRNCHPDICGDKGDCAIVESIINDGYDISWHTTHKVTGVEYYGFKTLRNDLQKIGMCYSRKRVEKHIPGVYMCSSIPQRLELLAGLLDTDGCLRRKERRYDFTTAEKLLKDDFISLVSTFGWRCSVKEVNPQKSSSGIQGRKTYWVISFNPTHPIPCRLERKQLFEFSKKRRIAIKKIEDIEPKYGNCISVQGGIYRVGKRCIPTHNSTLCIFFLAWIIGKRPASHNAMSGHSGILADRFYNDVQKLTENEEYTYHEIFPNVHLYKKSADKNELSYDEVESFATLTCRGIDGTWTGAVDISSDGYLYVDDLVRDRTESLSPVRLENRYQDYLNVLVDRKNDGSRELMVGTRWNVIDPLGKVETENKHNPRYRFRKIPALNENDESNFDYEYGKGFSSKHFIGVRSRLDKNEWEAKYQQRPFIREGLIFPENELAYFNGIVPDGGFVRVVGVTDVAWGGGDSLSMPVGYEYENGLIYIVDWIFNKGTKETTIPLVCGKIMGNSIQQTQFEADNGGEMYAKYVSDWLISQGYKCSITHKKAPNKQAKLARIIQYSDDIKRNFRFLSPNYVIDRESDKKDDADKGIKRFRRSKEYDAAMDELTMLVAIGKNEHDDSGDSLAQLENFLEGDIAKVEIWSRAALGI